MTIEGFIPPRSKTVLEITGNVPADFETTKDKFLEIQPECKYVIADDIPKGDGKFDAIILQSELIGALNHDPLVALIKKVAKRLTRRGTLLFTLDNVAYAENIMAILESGVPKFKTTLSKVELENAIDDSGLHKIRALHASRRLAVNRALVDVAKVDLSVFAYIISAIAYEPPPKVLIQSVIGEKLVCAPIRLFIPHSFLMTEPNISTASTDPNKPYRLFSAEEYQNRIFINQRMSYPSFANGVAFFHEMEKRNYLYVEEMDDHPVIWNDSYEKNGFINFVGVHAIQTSTEFLADNLREYNPNVKVFANQLRRILPLRDFDEEFKQEDRPVTIFFGALNRGNEFKEILPVLNQVAKDYGDKVVFKILAHQDLFNMLESEHKILIGDPGYYDAQFVNYDKYEETLRSADISLLPLQDNKFNRSKSDLKFIESAGCGATVLASPVAYAEVIKDGENGFIFYDTKEFADKLKILIDNRDKRREMAVKAYDYVKHNRMLSQHYEERLDWYLELLARLPELNQETQARIDKIAPKFAGEQPVLAENQSARIEGISPPNAEIIIPSDW